MVKKKLFILFALLLFCKCQKDKYADLIKEEPFFYWIYIIIIIASCIVSFVTLFIGINEKHKEENNIKASEVKINNIEEIQRTSNDTNINSKQISESNIDNIDKSCNIILMNDSKLLSNSNSERIEFNKNDNITDSKSNNKKKTKKIKSDDENVNNNEKVKEEEEKNYINKTDEINKNNNKEDNSFFNYSILGRLVLTIFSLEPLFFIYNLIIQNIFIFPGILYDMEDKILKYIFYIVYILFIYYSCNILTFPTYEFLKFPFLNYNNPFCHLNSFTYILYNDEPKDYDENKDKKESTGFNYIINVFIIIFEIIFGIIYIIGLFWKSIISIKDKIELFMLMFIFIYYLSIMFCYLFFPIYFFVYKIFEKSKNKCCNKIKCDSINNCKNKCKNKCIFKCKYRFKYENKENKENNENKENKENNENKENKENNENNENKENKRNNENNEKNNSRNVQTLNLIYFINNPCPCINNEYQCCVCEDLFYKIRLIFQIIIVAVGVIGSILYYDNFNHIFIILNFILLIFVFLSFDFCCINEGCCTQEKCCGIEKCCKFEKNLKNQKPENIQLLISRFISTIISVICIGCFLYVNTMDDFDNNDIIYEKINYLCDKMRNKSQEYYRNLTMHSFCYSGIHNMPIYLYMPFINDAYYFQNNKSTLNIEKYIKLFYDEDYKIDIIGKLTNDSNRMSKMVQYNIYTKRSNITILSIKGTSLKKDIYLDIQLYFPAILLNFINTYSTLDQQKEEMAFKFIEYGLSIPYRTFFKNFIFKKYLSDLIDAYENNEKFFLNNVVIIGHSLGGGLAKILGKMKRKQALSLSGPGMNSFHSLFNYEANSEYFELTSIDIIPDLDLVPRVDISGGTIYRILCKKSTFECHSKELSLCESLIMCRHPYAKQYCRLIADLNVNEINNLYNASDYNKNIKKIK